MYAPVLPNGMTGTLEAYARKVVDKIANLVNDVIRKWDMAFGAPHP